MCKTSYYFHCPKSKVFSNSVIYVGTCTGLAGMELIFFTAAHTVLYFRWVTKMALVTHSRFSYC